MKHKLLLICLFTLLLLTTVTIGVASMAGYTLPWWTVDGGGGTSNSTQYALSGTTGQADAGTLIGGDYTLAGGFWAGSLKMGSQLYLPIITR
jgi:hypothetical protein